MSIITTDVVSSYGAYYIAGGQNAKRLHQMLYFGSNLDKGFTQMPTKDTVIRMGSSSVTRLAQGWQEAWTPTGDVEFKPAEIQLYNIKFDFTAYPANLEQTWLGFLATEGLDPKQAPFVKWVIENHLLPGFNENIEINEAYKGVYAAPTPGTPAPISTAMNGIKKVINDHITAGDITSIVTGAWSADAETFCGEIEAFVAAIDERYRSMSMEIAMNPTLELRYRQGKRIKYNQQYAQDTDLLRLADFPNIRVAAKSAMTGSDKIYCTPIGNAICGVKKGSNKNAVMVESVDRQVKIWSDFYKGYGFVIPELVFTNDLDLV